MFQGFGLVLCFLAISLSLQGCDLPHIEGYVPLFSFDVPFHKIPYWRQSEEVYEKFSYVNKNGEQKFNSCMDKTMNALNVCNGRGFCEAFDRNDIVNPIFFCRCEPGWTGPECTTKQKSQTVAWLLSLFVGWIGIDQFYLQWKLWGAIKCLGLFVSFMLTAIGFGRVAILLVLSYWFSDIVKIGSAPVRAHDGKVAADLPRWAFAAFTLLYFAFIGFAMGVCSVYFKVKYKRRMDDHQRYYGSMQSFNPKVI
jgi:TM2 domain-containing membrane protein YozV